MKTTKQDPQLETELQELYILSKHWTSDINFAEDEIRILKDVLKKHFIHFEKLQLDEANDFYKMLALQDEAVLDLKRKVSEFLQFIKPLITGSTNVIGINLIEKFAVLNTDIQDLLDTVKQIKKSLFFFVETVMKTELASFLNQI
jgi:hypothetical protein